MTEEDRIQEGIVRYLRTVLPPAFVVFAIPNGGYRRRKTASTLKRTGTLAGIPDLGILSENGRSWWLEVKTSIGRLSDNQKLTHNLFHGLGIPLAVVRSIDDVREVLRAWQIPTVEAGG